MVDPAPEAPWEPITLPWFFTFTELLAVLKNNALLQRDQIIKMLENGTPANQVLAATQQLFKLDDFRTILLNNTSSELYEYSIDVNLKRQLKPVTPAT